MSGKIPPEEIVNQTKKRNEFSDTTIRRTRPGMVTSLAVGEGRDGVTVEPWELRQVDVEHQHNDEGDGH